MYVSREERDGLTKEYLDELFEYKDGNLYRKISRNARHKVGGKVGTVASHGYIMVGIDGGNYLLHRLIWLKHYGTVPPKIDHEDGNRKNNKIENLRIATSADNNQNARLRSDNKSGVKGVRWRSDQGKWHVVITANKTKHHLGYYEDFELAELVAIEAREKYHGKFARHS